jgi:hypothetical protein
MQELRRNFYGIFARGGRRPALVPGDNRGATLPNAGCHGSALLPMGTAVRRNRENIKTA